jgi:hypothetical protein
MLTRSLVRLGSPSSDGHPDGVYVTLGSVPPPAILDEDDEARARFIEKLRADGVKVNVLGQFHMSRRMLDDFIRVLQATAAKYDAAAHMASQERRQEQG